MERAAGAGLYRQETLLEVSLKPKPSNVVGKELSGSARLPNKSCKLLVFKNRKRLVAAGSASPSRSQCLSGLVRSELKVGIVTCSGLNT